MFPLTIRLSESFSAGQVINSTSVSGFVIPLTGINHVNISGWGMSFSNGVTYGNNRDVSSYDYITASLSFGMHNESLTCNATISIVD